MLSLKFEIKIGELDGMWHDDCRLVKREENLVFFCVLPCLVSQKSIQKDGLCGSCHHDSQRHFGAKLVIEGSGSILLEFVWHSSTGRASG